MKRLFFYLIGLVFISHSFYSCQNKSKLSEDIDHFGKHNSIYYWKKSGNDFKYRIYRPCLC